MFDWRELQRWGISENRLPPGSRVYFRTPSLWSQYRWQLLLVAAVILTEALLIVGLLYERRRRRTAEIESFRRMSELAHLNRVATAGALSASIAHEVRQPLAAMVAQSSAAMRWLARKTPDVAEARAALEKIAAAGQRASQIIENLRSMFRREHGAQKPLNINRLIESVIELTSREAQKHGVVVQPLLFEGPMPATTGDRAQLEQVFLNLIMNAIQAMSTSESGARVLYIQSSVSEAGDVLVTVADSGPGVAVEDLDRIFDPFFTTKPDGMGMGLSICRSIIDVHGGRLWASRGMQGLIFHVFLPVANRQ
jgi:signal transduction histidine kinase